MIKRDSIISAVNQRLQKSTHNYVIKVPTYVTIIIGLMIKMLTKTVNILLINKLGVLTSLLIFGNMEIQPLSGELVPVITLFST